MIFVNNIKGTRIQPQFLFLMEKSILYAKITVSKKNCFKTKFEILYSSFISIVTIMPQIPIKA